MNHAGWLRFAFLELLAGNPGMAKVSQKNRNEQEAQLHAFVHLTLNIVPKKNGLQKRYGK